MCEATVFVQTSTHEGFCLPALEAMATGAAVVCTDAHGNRDFCEDGVNCLMPAARVEAVRAALGRLLADPGLCERLGAAGMATAADYAWERRIDALEAFLGDVAAPHLVDLEMIAAAEAAADHRFSDIRGASRLNTHRPRAKTATMIPSGISTSTHPRARTPPTG